MTPQDLGAVQSMAATVHPAYPEGLAVFRERLSLFPAGCLVLEEEAAGHLLGYAISHPWHRAQPPVLDSLLGVLPQPASTYYLHDVALLPQARGQDAPSRLLGVLLRLAQTTGVGEVSLVAVNGSRPYWQGQRFEVVHEPALADKLLSYDADACLMRRRCD